MAFGYLFDLPLILDGQFRFMCRVLSIAASSGDTPKYYDGDGKFKEFPHEGLSDDPRIKESCWPLSIDGR